MRGINLFKLKKTTLKKDMKVGSNLSKTISLLCFVEKFPLRRRKNFFN